MQLMIDTNDFTAADARRLITMLADKYELPMLVMSEDVPAGAPRAVVVPAAPAAAVPQIVTPAAPAAPVEVLPDPAAVFAGANLPPPPPPPALATNAAGPAVTPTMTEAALAAVELDADGLPWDARIHAEKKSKNKDQTWRTKRGLLPGVLEAITAELKLLHGVQPVFTAAAAAGSLPPANIPAPPAANIPPPPVTLPVPAPPAPGVAAPVLSGAPTFATVMTKITGAMAAQKLTKPQVDEALTQSGIANLTVFSAAQPAAIAAVDAYLARWGV